MEIQLQSILKPSEDICDVKELYYHQNHGRIDFDGYFNLFYIKKRKKYTVIDGLILSLRLKGYTSITVFHDREELQTVEMNALQESNYRIELPYGEYKDGVFWFSATESEQTADKELKGFFLGRIDNEQVRTINIGIDICTYRREEYVVRNLNQLRTKLLEKPDLDVSSHLKVYVIDNGKTLEAHKEICEILKASDDIRVFPNKNAGGAGGFTRGMIEVLKDKNKFGLTHVMLMDDDAVIEPDSLVRVFGFLTTLKNEWKDITVGGIMIREDFPFMLQCAGEWWRDGIHINPNINTDLREYEKAASKDLTEGDRELDQYSGWWSCCYSLNTVRKDNLPLPIFIHHDDIEYCLRNREKGMVFLNGVGVWHREFTMTTPGANLYYDVRNDLIEISLHGEGNQKKVAARYLIIVFLSTILRLKFKDCQLIYRGVTDFMRGPKWLSEQDPEVLHQEIRGMAYAFKPLNEVTAGLTAQEKRDVELQIARYRKQYDAVWGNAERINASDRKKSKHCYLLCNGWILPADSRIQVVFSTDAPIDTIYKCFRKKKVLTYELGSGKGIITERRYPEMIKSVVLGAKSLALVSKQFNRVAEKYRDSMDIITKQKFWEEFLKES